MSSFVDRWSEAWGNPDPDKVRKLADPAIVIEWPGAGEPIVGADAWGARVARMLERFPDLRLEVTEHAERDDTSFISWRAHATVRGTAVQWQGIDRMHLRNGVVTRSLVVFDTAPMAALGAV